MEKQKKVEWVTNDFGHTYEVVPLFKGRSKFQKMEIAKHATFGTLLFLDGKIQVSELDENRYHQYLVAAPLLAHPDPKSVVIVGGGDCFGLEEAVKHSSLKRILMLEIDKGVVDFCRKHFLVVQKALRDPRIEVEYIDARAWLENHSEQFDVIVLDLTEPHGPSKLLYTREFYRLCKKRLKPDGIISMHADNPSLFPETYATLYKTLRSVFPHMESAFVDMPSFGMGWTYRLASPRPLDLEHLARRVEQFTKREIHFEQFSPSLYLQKPTLEVQTVIAKKGRISTDERPFDKFEKLEKKVLN